MEEQEHEGMEERRTPRVVRILEKGLWELKIDPDFEELLSPLDKETYDTLESSIKRCGCTETVKTWNRFIIDGHNRYKACWKLNEPFGVTEMEFADKSEVILWMIDLQIGRRNVTAFQRTALALKKKEIYEQKAKDRMLAGVKVDNPSQNSDQGSTKGRTDEHIAKDARVSRDTVSRVKKLQKYADEDTKRKLRRGEMSINKAYTETILKKHEGETKVCERCGKEKPVLEFPRSRGGLFFLPVCKECSKLEAPTMSTQPECESNKALSVAEEVSPQTSLDLTYDRFDAYPDATRLEHPIEVPNNVGESARMARPFTFVQGQVHFALKNMLKELRIGLNWLSEEDRNRIPELLGMLEEASGQAEQMIKKEMED